MKNVIKGIKAVLLAIICICGMMGAFLSRNDAEAAASKKYIVVLDPGHDETHIGARFNGLVEEDINLKLAKYCKQMLMSSYSNVQVYLTEPDEKCAFGGASVTTQQCLKQRALYAKKKKANLFVSFHVNSSTGTVASGVETYSATAYMSTDVGRVSHALATNMQNRLVALGLTNRGVKYANWIVVKDANEYGIPATLVEHGFIRNTSDRRWLSSDAKLKKMAQADAAGIAETLGLKKGKSQTVSDVEDEEEETSETQAADSSDEAVDEDGLKYNAEGGYYYYESVKVSKPFNTSSDVSKKKNND